MRRVVTILLIVCTCSIGCATQSMWNRQLRRASVSVLVGDHDAARSELALALSLAESPPLDPDMTAYTLARLAHVEILDKNWSEAEAYLRRAIEFNDSRGDYARGSMESNLYRLRWLLLQDARLEEAVATQQILRDSLATDRYKWVRTGPYGRPVRRLLDNAEQHGPAELDFARELADSGHAERAIQAFDRAEALGQDFELVREGNALLSLSRAKALAAVGRQAEAETIRTEAEAVRARSDYVDAALLHQRNFAIVARWSDDSMPLRIHLARPGSAVVREPDAAIRLVKEAARAWEDAAGAGRPRFRFVSSAGEADIHIQWRHERTFRGPVGVCHYRARWGDDPLQGARVTLISRMMGRYLNDDILRAVAIHEIGHSLGLLGHSTREDDIMYRSISRTPRTAPSERDLRTIRRLYNATPGQAYNP